MHASIAIILPAHNEELTIVPTLEDFHRECPEAAFYVIDNASTDGTGELATEAIARLGCEGRVLVEPRKGKAIAVRRAFLEVTADVYVLVDADLTYPASDLSKLLRPVLDGEADVVCGDRHCDGVYRRENQRFMHDFGNRLVRAVVNFSFKGDLRDVFSGYRVLSRRFVKNYPILSNGFELETEMSIFALDRGYSVVELPTAYRDRPQGSESKLNTLTDGLLVLRTIFVIFVSYRPLAFFTCCALFFAVAALAAGSVPVIEFIQTSQILHIPLAILATGLSILAMLSFSIAVILDAVAKAQRANHALQLLHWGDRGT